MAVDNYGFAGGLLHLPIQVTEGDLLLLENGTVVNGDTTLAS